MSEPPGAEHDDDGQVLVRSSYRALDLFAGSLPDFVAWSSDLRGGLAASEACPGHFHDDSKSLLVSYLAEARLLNGEGRLDNFRLQEFQRVARLLPYFKQEEAHRLPVSRSRIVFTVPPEVQLAVDEYHLHTSLAGRVSDALVSAQGDVLLASPYWSVEGLRNLMPSMQRAIAGNMAVTLAGARRQDEGHHAAMLEFGEELRRRGCRMRVLTFVPPRPHSIFHAKLVCGRIGYLGSANLTGSGLADHVEAGVPLEEVDVARVWWLVSLLQRAGLLVTEGETRSAGVDWGELGS